MYHDSKKQEIVQAREEIVSLYKVCKKQQQIIVNVEEGVYSNGIRSCFIPNIEKPRIPDRQNTKFLKKALNKLKVSSSTKDFYNESYDGEAGEGELIETELGPKSDQRRSTLNKHEESRTGSALSKDKAADNVVGAEGVRKETLDQLIAERDKFKSMYQAEVKKNNNSKIVIESQKRQLDKSKMETMSRKAGGYDMMRPKTQYRFK